MHFAFALPAPAETGAGGGADYIDGLAAGLREIGIPADILLGPDPVFPAGSVPVIDGMLLPSLHGRLEELVRRGAVVLVHHIAAASGRDGLSRDDVHAIEREMLPRLRLIVATSVPVAERVTHEFGLAAHAVPPGARDRAPATPDPAAPIVFSLGVLTRRKGHEELIRAAARLLDLPWHLIIAGDTQRDTAYPAFLQALIGELGMTDRISLLADPAPEALDQIWQRTTIFALASRWEGYPSAVAEALRRGIPALVTAGANADAILPSAAGAICPADDRATFGKCLRRMLFDDTLRADMAVAALAAGRALPLWRDRAQEFADLLERNP